MVKRKRNQKILVEFMEGRTMTEIHNKNNGKLSIVTIHRIIKQEAYHLLRLKTIKDLSPMALRDQYKDDILARLQANKKCVEVCDEKF